MTYIKSPTLLLLMSHSIVLFTLETERGLFMSDTIHEHLINCCIDMNGCQNRLLG